MQCFIFTRNQKLVTMRRCAQASRERLISERQGKTRTCHSRSAASQSWEHCLLRSQREGLAPRLDGAQHAKKKNTTTSEGASFRDGTSRDSFWGGIFCCALVCFLFVELWAVLLLWYSVYIIFLSVVSVFPKVKPEVWKGWGKLCQFKRINVFLYLFKTNPLSNQSLAELASCPLKHKQFNCDGDSNSHTHSTSSDNSSQSISDKQGCKQENLKKERVPSGVGVGYRQDRPTTGGGARCAIGPYVFRFYRALLCGRRWMLLGLCSPRHKRAP